MCRHRGELTQRKYKGDQLRLVGSQRTESLSSFIYHGGVKEGTFFFFLSFFPFFFFADLKRLITPTFCKRVGDSAVAFNLKLKT